MRFGHLLPPCYVRGIVRSLQVRDCKKRLDHVELEFVFVITLTVLAAEITLLARAGRKPS